ncbi:hypothetical protein EYF80_045172 [Liparis tanakae]|uniref:Uncharacterized protein n=1 Tax=Liparis tanakae TaxID=230148 RepID=A0A4Z2FU33_9TELE|nr:hypothetical protein EYF80_045172 [Liparis tanakae]
MSEKGDGQPNGTNQRHVQYLVPSNGDQIRLGHVPFLQRIRRIAILINALPYIDEASGNLNNNAIVINENIPIIEDNSEAAGDEVGASQGDEDPLAGGSRKRSRVDDEEDFNNSHNAEVPEVNPPPGPFRKRTRKTNRCEVEESDEEQEEKDPRQGRSRKRSRENDEEDKPTWRVAGGSRKGSREDDEEDFNERSSKQCRWWDEMADSDDERDDDSIDNSNNAEVPEENPPPGPFRKRTRKTNRCEVEESDKEQEEKDPRQGRSRKRSRENDEKEDEPTWRVAGGSRKRSRKDDEENFNERSSKQCRWWDEMADSDNVRDDDSIDNSNNAEIPEENPPPGPFRKRTRKTNRCELEESDEEQEEKDPRQGRSIKRSRENDEEEDKPTRKNVNVKMRDRQ